MAERLTFAELAEIRNLFTWHAPLLSPAAYTEALEAAGNKLLADIDALAAQLENARIIARRLPLADGWTPEECDLLGELCEVLDVEEDA